MSSSIVATTTPAATEKVGNVMNGAITPAAIANSDDIGIVPTVPSTTHTTNLTTDNTDPPTSNDIVRDGVNKEIIKYVVRAKLQKLRHLVLKEVISPQYLDTLFPLMLQHFDPQTVHYNGGIANIKEWKISCYLEVMDGGIPCTNPNLQLLDIFQPLLTTCNDLFLLWYRQQHSCNQQRRSCSSPKLSSERLRSVLTNKNDNNSNKNNIYDATKSAIAAPTDDDNGNNNNNNEKSKLTCRRVMTFITRYTPAPGEQALLKHVDGAGKVDGSVVVALPIDRWSAPEDVNSFIGHGGGITFWDGKKDPTTKQPQEIHYETRSGDLAFIDRAVWHQADPITKGTRWALVIFYEVDQVADDNNGEETTRADKQE